MKEKLSEISVLLRNSRSELLANILQLEKETQDAQVLDALSALKRQLSASGQVNLPPTFDQLLSKIDKIESEKEFFISGGVLSLYKLLVLILAQNRTKV